MVFKKYDPSGIRNCELNILKNPNTRRALSFLLLGTQYYDYEGNRLVSLSNMRVSAYSYDSNGNQKADSYRAITDISYNYLNLPKTISGSKSISYTYDATGRKLKKVSNISGTTDYVNGIQYKNISGTYQIEFVQTGEGRALKNIGATSALFCP